MYRDMLEMQQRIIRGYQRAMILMLIAGISIGITIQGLADIFLPWLTPFIKMTANILCLGGSALVIYKIRREIKQAREFLK